MCLSGRKEQTPETENNVIPGHYDAGLLRQKCSVDNLLLKPWHIHVTSSTYVRDLRSPCFECLSITIHTFHISPLILYRRPVTLGPRP